MQDVYQDADARHVEQVANCDGVRRGSRQKKENSNVGTMNVEKRSEKRRRTKGNTQGARKLERGLGRVANGRFAVTM
jgi:hypothetical protein